MVQADKRVGQVPPVPRAETSPAPIESFDDFFKQNYRLLLRTALIAGASFHEAEDAVGEVVTDLCRRWEAIVDPKAYACTAVARAVIRARRRDRERVRRTLVSFHGISDLEDDAGLINYEGLQRVIQLLHALPKAQREVLACVYDGLSNAEIAKALGKSEATVRKNLQFARERVKSLLARERERRDHTDPATNPVRGEATRGEDR